MGRPAVCDDDGRWREFAPGLRSAALGYLAFQARWVSRDELLALFWPDRPEATARGNLRPLLARLARDRRVPGLERERSRVRWRTESDVADLLQAERERRWPEVWGLAVGSLLEGVTVARAPEFESWLAIERERVREVVRSAGVHVADAAIESGELEEAVAVLAALQRLDPLDEAVVRRLMTTLARRGARGDALGAFAAFVERCRDELGVEPEHATYDLAEAIRSGAEGTVDVVAPAPRAPPPTRLPVPLTPLVGRRRETAEVSNRLRDPSCRLLTLVGPGGIGKTRLALDVVRLVAPRFADGACVADLAPVSSDAGARAAVADALGVSSAEGDEARSIARDLVGKELLLLLDNVEHLASVPALLSELLQSVPGMRVLVTSRTVLGLAAETRYDVVGLAHRSPTPSGEGTSDADVARRAEGAGRGAADGPSEAANLFVAAGRRAAPDFEPAPRDLEVIEGVVASLAGSPLAIELAAAWVRAVDVREVADELERGIHLLVSEAPDRSPRHSSMQDVLDQSWSLLQPREREAMRRTAVFHGGFDLAAAREVAGLELPVLLALVNKSFVARDADGRYARHPLVWRDVRQRALAQAAAFQETRSRHSHYYLRLLAERPDAFHHPEGPKMLHEIHVDLENVRAAWLWAVERRDHARLQPAIGALIAYAWFRKRSQLIDDLFGAAIDTAPSDSVLHGLLAAGIGCAQTWAGRGDFGVRRLRDGARSIEGRAEPADRAWVNVGLGLALARQDERAEALTAYERAAECYRELGLVVPELAMLNNVVEGRASGAVEALDGLVALEHRLRREGPPAHYVLSFVLAGIAGLRQLLGEHAEGIRAARARGAFEHLMGGSFLSWGSRNLLAMGCFAAGHVRRAEAIACGTLRRTRFVEARRRHPDEVSYATALVGRIALVRGDLDGAAAWSRRALERHREEHRPEASFAFVGETLARVALAEDDPDGAAAWLEVAERGPEPRWYEGPLATTAQRVALLTCAADVRAAQGEAGLARATLRDALEFARSDDLVAPGLATLVSAARCLGSSGADRRRDRLLRYVRDHPRAPYEARWAAARALADGAPAVAAGADDGVDGVERTIADVASELTSGGVEHR